MYKYLIIAPSWIGDMIMANALFRLLKQNHPDCVIDVLAPAWSHPVIARMREVRRTIVMPLKHGAFELSERYQIGKSLRQEKYSQAIVLPNSWKSALIPYFAHIKKRSGWRGEWRYGLLNDIRVLDKKRYPLMVNRYLALGAATEISRHLYPRLLVDPLARDVVLKKYAISRKKPLLILCPGAQYGQSKRWPRPYFTKVAKHYLQQGWQVGLLGGEAESEIAMTINADLDGAGLDLTMTTLTEAIDLISCANVVVSNDSGLMHIACALNVPTIAIYGSSSPDFTPPLNPKAVILSMSLPCKPCFKRECPLGHLDCLTMITPEAVITKIQHF